MTTLKDLCYSVDQKFRAGAVEISKGDTQRLPLKGVTQINIQLLFLQEKLSSQEMSVEVKWENYMVAHKNRDLQKAVSAQI